MYENIIAVILLALSFIPSFAQKNDLEKKLQKEFVITKSETTKEANEETKIIPQKNEWASFSISARSALFIDKASGEVLFAKNEKEKLPMASTTKLMTAIIALENLDENDILTVPNVASRPLDSVVGLAAGDNVKLNDLLHGLLIESGSDAALTISNKVAGDENKFAAMMNEEARVLGLNDTQFTNSVGYDDNAHYSTANDLVKLARIALSNKTIAEIVGKRNHTLKTEEGKAFYLTNTNKLLGNNFKGIKTGTTFAAGECLVSLYKDENGREIIGVVLGSPDRFYETQGIINWAKNNFSW